MIKLSQFLEYAKLRRKTTWKTKSSICFSCQNKMQRPYFSAGYVGDKSEKHLELWGYTLDFCKPCWHKMAGDIINVEGMDEKHEQYI